MSAPAEDIFGGHAVFDADLDRLRLAKNNEPTPLGTSPPPYVPEPRTFRAGPHLGPQPVKPLPPKPKVQRPGWME